LVIEYPPGYVPSYNDGRLNLQNRVSAQPLIREYEDQELEMTLEDESDDDLIEHNW